LIFDLQFSIANWQSAIPEWVDKGFGGIPSGSRRWYNRRHRRHYVVKDADGQTFEIYLDYANRQKRTWWLLYKLA